jgi:hypothetical protein
MQLRSVTKTRYDLVTGSNDIVEFERARALRLILSYGIVRLWLNFKPKPDSIVFR